ncbi:MAG TPA: ion channel [Candidatus Acidoferrum sp.]|nr:ion channel [Candidatus Acidoferrum sp.]
MKSPSGQYCSSSAASSRSSGLPATVRRLTTTTLGYGDVVMSAAWKILGLVEAADGMLMFGISTALVFALIQRLIQTRFEDLRDQAFTPEETSP